ncbi:MAG: tripartite tricarboxylate transporter substrate binding protein [Comamonadaceae bacterium]|nr:MAG: tripartite tricarboxylate transporter substrate binding protein [Comamonadaceae bacterium]
MTNPIHRRVARRAAVAALGAAALFGFAPAFAQAYPNKPIKLVVPFTAGGGYDVLARAVGLRMQTALGQPVVIENKGGAGGGIGAALVAKAPADGYTLLFGSAGSQLVLPLTTPNLSYNDEKDFVPVGHVATSDFIMVVKSDSKFQTLKEALDAAKAKPNSVSYMSTGVRGAIHIFNAYLHKVAGGVSMVHVPYAGEAPAVADMLEGRVDMTNITVSVAMPFIREGKIRPLVAIGTQRSEMLPDVPTVAEAGYPGPAMVSWVGVFAPAGTSPEIVQQLNKAVNVALADPEVQKRIKDSASRSQPGSPEQFKDFLGKERARWATMVREAGNLN